MEIFYTKYSRLQLLKFSFLWLWNTLTKILCNTSRTLSWLSVLDREYHNSGLHSLIFTQDYAHSSLPLDQDGIGKCKSDRHATSGPPSPQGAEKGEYTQCWSQHLIFSMASIPPINMHFVFFILSLLLPYIW